LHIDSFSYYNIEQNRAKPDFLAVKFNVPSAII